MKQAAAEALGGATRAKKSANVGNAAGFGPRGGEGVDFYPTPAWCTRAVLAAIPGLPGGVWMEPSVGSAAIVRAVDGARREEPRALRWIGCEIRDVRPLPPIAPDDLRIGDFLDPATCAGLPRPDVIIGNPPYSHALPFAARCLEIADGHAWVLMLLRLAFLETEERRPFLQRNPPDVYPLSRRPSFTGDGATDGAAAAWIVWPPHGAPRRVGCAPIDTPDKQLVIEGCE